jgi:ferredoxin
MIDVNQQYCPQNHPCPTLRVCPADALSQEGFSAPKVDEEKCLDCGACIESCRVFSQGESANLN